MAGLHDLLRRLTDGQSGDRALIIGVALSAVWLLLVLVFRALSPAAEGGGGGLSWLMSAVAVLMPLALIWMAVMLARSVTALRAEADQLRAQLTAMRGVQAPRESAAEAPRETALPVSKAPPGRTPLPEPGQRPAPVPQPQRRAAQRPVTDARQPQLFDTPQEVAELPLADLLRALNFPDGPQDQPAIRSLRLALQSPELSRLIRAAQDVVTLFAQSGLYMDDLPGDGADRPDLWRRFAMGERGNAVAPIGAAIDAPNLNIAGGLMRGDEVFRDVAHHFLRHFDRLLAAKAPELDDDALAAFADTRSARAFALLARVTGMLG